MQASMSTSNHEGVSTAGEAAGLSISDSDLEGDSLLFRSEWETGSLQSSGRM